MAKMGFQYEKVNDYHWIVKHYEKGTMVEIKSYEGLDTFTGKIKTFYQISNGDMVLDNNITSFKLAKERAKQLLLS